MPIEFDATNKWILIKPWDLSIQTADEGTNIVVINEAIPTDAPQTGKLWLGITTSRIHCFRDFSSGFDYLANPKHFKIKTTAGGPDVIELDANCLDRTEVVNHINEKLASAFHDHTTWMQCIEDPFDEIHIVFACPHASLRCGLRMESVYQYGHPDSDEDLEDAMYHFMLPESFEDLGSSDIYDYVSWSGSTFVISGTLTMTYTSDFPVSIAFESIEMQELYNETMDWADEQNAIDDSVPLAAVGKAELGGGVFTDKIFILQDGWKLKPWTGIYALTFKGTTITDDGSPRVVSPELGRVDTEFVTSSFATVVLTSGLSETDKEEIASYVWNHTTAATLGDRVNLVRKIQENSFKVTSNQLIIYEDNGFTPLKIFNLKDKAGLPTETDVYEREEV